MGHRTWGSFDFLSPGRAAGNDFDGEKNGQCWFWRKREVQGRKGDVFVRVCQRCCSSYSDIGEACALPSHEASCRRDISLLNKGRKIAYCSTFKKSIPARCDCRPHGLSFIRWF